MNKENKIMLSIFFILLISLFYYNLSFNITGRVIDPVEAKDICLKESNNKYNTCIEPCGISFPLGWFYLPDCKASCVNEKNIRDNQCQIEYEKTSLKSNGLSCQVNNECSSNNCFQNVCRVSGYECSVSSDCSTGKECTENKCVEKLLLPDLIVKDAYFGYLTKIEMSSSINYFQDLVFFTENIGGRKRTGLIKRGVTFDITKNGIKLPYSSDELYFNGHDSLFSSIEFYGNQDGEKNKSIPGTPSSGSIKLRPKETAIYCIENIIVDPENLVIESNENNNELKKGGCINVGPDIIIERLHFYSVVFEGGRATKPSKIINAKVGDAVIIGLEAIDVNQEYFSAHGSSYDYLVESKIIIKKNGLPIKEGKPSAGIFGKRKDDLYSRDVSFTFTEAGEYCLDGETDITNAVKEYNENNNKVENSQCITVTEVLLSPPVLKTKGQQCSSSTECSSGNCLNSVCELAGAECNARVSCATGKECKDNKCITVTQVPPPTPEPIPQPIPTLKSVECNGCLDKDICLPFGFRIEGKYCNTDKSLKVQKEEELSCNNNFECLSNQCSNNKCINLQKQLREQVGLLKKIWCKLFHPLNENNYNACLVETLS